MTFGRDVPRAMENSRPVPTSGKLPHTELTAFAARYTAAWCSRSAESVAKFFAPDGSLKINGGDPSVGRIQITVAVQDFMTAFPDLAVRMDQLRVDNGRVKYHWTLTGTNTGPGGTGKAVHITGHEEWRIAADGLIAESRGYFDEAEYQRQLKTSISNAH